MNIKNILIKLKLLKIEHYQENVPLSNEETRKLIGYDTTFKMLSSSHFKVLKINYYKTEDFEYSFIKKFICFKVIDNTIYTFFGIFKIKHEEISYMAKCLIEAKPLNVRVEWKEGSTNIDITRDTYLNYYVYSSPSSLDYVKDPNNTFINIDTKCIKLNKTNVEYDSAINVYYDCKLFPPEYFLDLICQGFIAIEDNLKTKLILEYNSGRLIYKLTNKKVNELKELSC